MRNYNRAIVILFLAGQFLSGCSEEADKNENTTNQREELKQQISLAIENMVSRNNAFSGWENNLVDSTRFRMNPIFTIELEELWLVDRPLLFYGMIEDISSKNNDEAVIEVQVVTSDQSYISMDTVLYLNLTMDLKAARQFLSSNSELKQGSYFDRRVAIVAKIDDISKSNLISAESNYGEPILEETEVKIGNGRLIEIIHLGGFFY